jgi:hypothetical protein
VADDQTNLYGLIVTSVTLIIVKVIEVWADKRSRRRGTNKPRPKNDRNPEKLGSS